MEFENKYLEVVERKQTITSLELLEQINFFRKQEDNKTELGHNDLLKIVRNEFEEEIAEGKISHGSYKDKQNQLRPMFILTLSQSKQVLMRESKFVRKAVINYIEILESKLNQSMTIEEMIISQAKSMMEVKDKIEALEDKINNQMTIDHGEQRKLQREIAIKVYERAETIPKFVTEGGKISDKNTKVVRMLFSSIYKEIKNKFGVTSYKDVKFQDYNAVLIFVRIWREDQIVRDKIFEI